MMSASALSAQIRAKKKKMEEAGDLTDADAKANDEEGEKLSENHPSDAMGMNADSPELTSPDPEVNGEKEERKAKIKTMLRKMGK